MVLNVFGARRRGRGRFPLYRPAVWLLEDRSLPSFLGPASYPVGHDPAAVAVADFNGDGLPDLAVSNSGDNTVSVLPGRGDGAFGDAVTSAAGVGPMELVAGDFNGDGAPDLAVINFNQGLRNTVSVLRGNGDGTFWPPTTYPCGQYARGLVAGDFNGDGLLDLAVANADGVVPDHHGNVRVLLGNGDGTFQRPAAYGVGVDPVALAAGDFNGDGLLDLAAANMGTDPTGTRSSLSLLWGTGDGSFQPPVDFLAGRSPLVLAVGDFSSDGLPDLAVWTGRLTILSNRGDGSFDITGDYAVGGDPTTIVAADFNGDGAQDLAFTNYGPQTLAVLPGNGDGTFQPPVVYAAGASPEGLATADFNGDGAPDFAVTNYGGASVSAFLNRGDGTFQASVQMGNPGYGSNPNSAVAGDFNGDGQSDLAVASFSSSVAPGTVTVFLGNGDGTFQPPVGYQVGVGPEALAVGDFNGDGIPDLAAANFYAHNVSILLGRGDGTFAPAVNYDVGVEPRALVVGDFDNDGIPDLAVANYASATVNILLGRGDGTFTPAAASRLTDLPLALAAGDFNGDGILDLATVNQGHLPDYIGSVNILLGQGDGSFQPVLSFNTGTAVRYAAAVAADFNGDGLADLAVVGGGTIIFLSNGDGSFQRAAYYPVGFEALTLGDFNGDGAPDLAAAGPAEVSVLLGHGDGSFGPPLKYVAGYRPDSLAVADFNGDGFPDLAATNWQGWLVLFNAGDWDQGAAGAAPRDHARTQAPALPLRALALAREDVPSAPVVNHHPATPHDSRSPLPGPTAAPLDHAGRPLARPALRPGAARVAEDAALPDWADGIVDWPDGSGTPLR